ncbi:tRNA dihydrouridine synthase DusB [Piscirickettsia litoralis]|uniref:tRNA-dihydrouridine synthase B n=1 Tax=Piscirickettsia litoralis TaxID=1891921 RepID=A0ABX3A6T9_9GAMM|nr:tRNA dihydrouridine synthase DusB [Piscirickettsia litoralis]ODN43220.1 tRNA dihydrouridine synthase DusB [Piscirickettsia litoralis]
MKIGPYSVDNRLILAPMAGVTDRPFRMLCKRLGAGLVVSEMVSSQQNLRKSRKTQLRMDHRGEVAPIVVQLLGTDPEQMAEAARFNVEHGAEVIDINMGCPAKKVCHVAAGSALMQHESLVADILAATVAAVDVPVTLKMRTGWSREHKNAVKIAKIAEQAGIVSLAVHGRTRQDLYKGEAEYETISAVKQAVKIPVVANGDIDSPEKAKYVLEKTGADALMVGRAAQGNPWIFQQIDHYLRQGEHSQPVSLQEKYAVMCEHLENLYSFYGTFMGVRIARKHVGWYLQSSLSAKPFRKQFNALDDHQAQLGAIQHFFEQQESECVPYAS